MSEIILERIMDGRYLPGLRIPAESDLADEFGCGRSTIREALRHLSTLGVVVSRRGSGAAVLDFRREGCSMDLLVPWLAAGEFEQPLDVLFRELFALRTHLACEGARLAALYAPAGALAPVRAVVEKSRRLEQEPVAHALNDVELHRVLIAASRIWPAVWQLNALRRPLAELARKFPAVAIVPDGYADRMHSLLDLVEARNAPTAVSLLRDHLARVDAVVFSLLEGGMST